MNKMNALALMSGLLAGSSTQGSGKSRLSWHKPHQGTKECARRVRQGAMLRDRLNTHRKYRYGVLSWYREYRSGVRSWYPSKGKTKAQLKQAGL